MKYIMTLIPILFFQAMDTRMILRENLSNFLVLNFQKAGK